MDDPALLDHHSHDSITVDFSPLFVHSHNLIYPDITHKIAGNKDKVVCDNSMRIDITEGVPWCECLLGGDDRNNLET